MSQFWVVEYNGVPQFGSVQRYEAIEKGEENFGSYLDKNGEAYKIKLYEPSDEPSVGRVDALRSEGFEEVP